MNPLSVQIVSIFYERQNREFYSIASIGGEIFVNEITLIHEKTTGADLMPPSGFKVRTTLNLKP